MVEAAENGAPMSSTHPEVFIPPWWAEAAEAIACTSSPPVAAVCGPKNSGKSTFSRHLLNILLQRFAAPPFSFFFSSFAFELFIDSMASYRIARFFSPGMR